MAKRKRLTPPRPDYMEAPEAARIGPGLSGVTPPPISHIAGDAAATGALREVAEEMTAARRDGRFVLRLPLDEVDETWLVRDRLVQDPEALESLKDSLRRHGQRTPIEVTEIAPGRYGLISGWRRLMALRQLQAEPLTADAANTFETVLALPRTPKNAEDAYVAMIEENEIRVGLSYFERARIAAKAVEAGIFETDKQALQRLYASASRAKRSKIGSFLRIYHALHPHLKFAAALPERVGLALARSLDERPELVDRIAEGLKSAPSASAEEEQSFLLAAMKVRPAKVAQPPVKDVSADTNWAPGVEMISHQPASAEAPGKLVLAGAGLTPELIERLRLWLSAQ